MRRGRLCGLVWFVWGRQRAWVLYAQGPSRCSLASLREGPSWCPEALLKIVGTDVVGVERALLAGELGCPDCGGRLGPWGWARWRVVRRPGGEERRRPRRSRCASCAGTHVLVGDDTLVRRRDAVEVIGAALVAKATGVGHRRAAAMVGVPVSTVRGWLRRFARSAEQVRVWFTVLAHDLDPLLAPVAPTGTLVGDAVEAIAVAARAASLRLAPVAPWRFASAASQGRLLANTGWPWAAVG